MRPFTPVVDQSSSKDRTAEILRFAQNDMPYG
jgi:hypothetical protein